MKQILYILFLLSLFSCEDHFFNNNNELSVIDTDEERIQLLNGIYHQLIKVHDNNYFALCTRSDDVCIAPVLKSVSYGNNGEVIDKSRFDDFDFEGAKDLTYKNLYTAIINANRLLSELDQSEHSELIGEVYLLRAYCYFKLARFFGKPTIVDDYKVNYTLKRPTYREVYEFIEQDLLMAIELLPLNQDHSRKPQIVPNVGVAKAMLAEVYLSMAGYPVNDHSKYSEAARLSEEVISEAESFGFGLLENFAHLWMTENNNHKETVFGLFFLNSEKIPPSTYLSYEHQHAYNRLNINISINASDNAYHRHFFADGLSSFSDYRSTYKFYELFPNDYRKTATFCTGIHRTYNTDIPGLEGNFQSYDEIKNFRQFVWGSFYLKWIDLPTDFYAIDNNPYYYRYILDNSTIPIHLFRYAHVLLTYAEAKARSGNLDASAYEAINQIRRRANHVDINSPSKFDLKVGLDNQSFIDSVLNERRWELCFEPEGRWFDIIRLNLKDSLNSFAYSYEKLYMPHNDFLSDDWYFYKTPQEDRWLNPNLDQDTDTSRINNY